MTILAQNSLVAGEITPLLHARPELDLYRKGVAELQNFLILPQGGVTRRPGTVFVSEVKSSAGKVRLVPFQFSTEDVYMLEFGNLYMRVYKNGAQIESGGSPYEIVTPFTIAEVEEMSFTQSGDYLFIDHENHPPQELTRVADDDWAIETQELFDGPYDPEQYNKNNNLGVFASTTLTPGGTSGATTITASGSGLTSFFVEDDIGRVIRLYDSSGSVWGSAIITSYTNALVVGVTTFFGMDFGSTTGTTRWRLGSWSDQHGWPRHVVFHEQRLVHAGTPTYVNRVWGSRPDDFRSHSPSDPDGQVDDSHAYAYSLATGSFDDIKWLQSDRALMCGTSSGPFALGGADPDTPITPLSIRAKFESALGCNTATPVHIAESIIYARKGGTGIIGAKYSFEKAGFVGQDISSFSEHLFRRGVTVMSSAIIPFYTVVCLTTVDDEVLTLTYFPEQGVLAWSHWTIGGTDVVVESVAVIPDQNDDHSQIWLVVKRTINGQTKRYIEYFNQVFDTEDVPVKDDMHFVDCGIIYDGAATTTITGLDHLEGQTVQVVADGYVHDERVVDSGEITLDAEASVVHVGLACPCHLKSLPVEYLSDSGGTQHKIKRISHLYANIFNSMAGLQFGKSLGDLETVALRTPDDLMDDSIPLFSGTVDLPYDGGYDRDQQYFIYQGDPVSLTIRSIGAELQVHGRQ